MINNKNYNTTLRTKKTAIFQNGCNKVSDIINVHYSTVGIRKAASSHETRRKTPFIETLQPSLRSNPGLSAYTASEISTLIERNDLSFYINER
jgi:hypothetical protein